MRFSHDRRGQSVVIGTVILFGFLILALSLYQVQVVPQQNAQTEFEHFEEVRNDLVELRAGILQAGSVDQPQYQTVRLGTTYSTRIFAINPPDPAGTIRTTDSYNITIEGSGESVNVSTRFIQYRPGYNEIDQSPTWYDASVLYVDARDEGGGIAVIEDQELVTSDGEVRVVALQNEFRRSGAGRVTLELRPADNVTETLPEGDLTVTVPTRLSEDDWKNETDLPTDSDIYRGVTDDANGDGVYNLTLNTTAENLTLDTVGVGEAPEEAAQNDNAAIGGSDRGSGGPATVNVISYMGLKNNEQINTNFDIENSDGSSNAIQVTIRDDPGGKVGGDWSQKTVVIDGNTFELTTEAANDIGLAQGERDLFDAASYESATQSELNNLRDSITTESSIVNIQQSGKSLDIRIRSR
ncbi:hypothetical protein [Halorubrum sp. CBA1229]|uniref:hypothetical protein n=1 Tax=Halorubrum sp. CBA1229 TaxID=1853699 RepID=UPI000F3C684E|nr:hypothetical protein [Halorubrum sp. CBA1229]QKY17055.1 hypothetical protein Hrr1229_009240 [Halorubrum sp. CBA1229]